MIEDTVGAGGANRRGDVRTVQRLINLCVATVPVIVDGLYGPQTGAAIKTIQRRCRSEDDGLLGPGDDTIAAMIRYAPHSFSADTLGLIFANASEADIRQYAAPISQTMEFNDIETPLRQAHFLAQIGHESGEFRYREELASGAAYEGRVDLGNSEVGDGRRFKGRGLIQLTGRNNYRAFGMAMGLDLLQSPGRVATDRFLAADAAGWFWAMHDLNRWADSDDIRAITRIINGGYNGINDRKRLLQRAKTVLKV